MAFKGFLKTGSMPNTHTEVKRFHFDLMDKNIHFIIGTWADDTKSQFLGDITYVVDMHDPLWVAYFDKFIGKNDLSDAIYDYLETRAELADATKLNE